MPGVFEVYIKTHFSAAHNLCGYPGDCARVHGHNWIVEVFVQCQALNNIGIGVDFRDIKSGVQDVLAELDHTSLNDHPAFADLNPTSENIARFLFQELNRRMAGVFEETGARVSKVKVSETPGAGAFYWEE